MNAIIAKNSLVVLSFFSVKLRQEIVLLFIIFEASPVEDSTSLFHQCQAWLCDPQGSSTQGIMFSYSVKTKQLWNLFWLMKQEPKRYVLYFFLICATSKQTEVLRARCMDPHFSFFPSFIRSALTQTKADPSGLKMKAMQGENSWGHITWVGSRLLL